MSFFQLRAPLVFCKLALLIMEYLPTVTPTIDLVNMPPTIPPLIAVNQLSWDSLDYSEKGDPIGFNQKTWVQINCVDI
jgi:hypothetical protein